MGWRAVRHPTQLSGWVLHTQAQVVQAMKVTCLSLLETCTCGLCHHWEVLVQDAGNGKSRGGPGCKLMVWGGLMGGL